MKNCIGIDFGTCNTFIYVPDKGSVYNEPTLIAINTSKKKVEETGYLASKLIGRTSKDVEVYHPVLKGVIARINPSIFYLEKAFKEAKINKIINKNSVLFPVPSDITSVEKQALETVAHNLGFKEAIFANQGLLANIGSSFDQETKRGSLIVNIGGGITDIVVSVSKDIIVAKSTFFSGQLLDQALLRHIRVKHHLLIGEKAAEYIKMKIGSVEIYPENRLIEVSGKDITSSLPHSIILSTNEIRNVLLPKMEELIDTISDTLALIPPEVAADIVSDGICISGGGALLAGMREFLEKRLNLPVRLAPDPLTNVVNGMRIYIQKYL